jgi:hypothetical protein
MNLQELKEKYEEIAGRWDGDTPRGEDEALLAQDVLDLIKSIENDRADHERIGKEIVGGEEKLKELIEK